MLLRLDAFTAVTIPDELTEAARDLVRAWEDCRSAPGEGQASVVEAAAAPRDRLFGRAGVEHYP